MTQQVRNRWVNLSKYGAGFILGAPLIVLLVQNLTASGNTTQNAVITESAKDSQFFRDQFITQMKESATSDGKVCVALERVAIALERSCESDVAVMNKMDSLLEAIEDDVLTDEVD